jgi:hypothetical protein
MIIHKIIYQDLMIRKYEKFKIYIHSILYIFGYLLQLKIESGDFL